MNGFKKFINDHPAGVKVFICCYIAFAGCFTFPLWSREFPLTITKAYMVAASYGIIALAMAGIYGPEKEKTVYIQTFGLTMIGLLCRYLLEFGEVSNTYNFTLFHVFLYLLVIPMFTVTAYHLMVKGLRKNR